MFKLALTCDISWDWYDTLITTTLAPLVVVGLLGAAQRALHWRSAPLCGFEVEELREKTAMLISAVIFLAYPMATNAVFTAFNCRTFDGGDEPNFERLEVDYSIDCSTGTYHSLVGYAAVMIVIWCRSGRALRLHSGASPDHIAATPRAHPCPRAPLSVSPHPSRARPQACWRAGAPAWPLTPSRRT